MQIKVDVGSRKVVSNKYITQTSRNVGRRICWGRPWLASRQLCLNVRELTDPSGRGRMDLHLRKRRFKVRNSA